MNKALCAFALLALLAVAGAQQTPAEASKPAEAGAAATTPEAGAAQPSQTAMTSTPEAGAATTQATTPTPEAGAAQPSQTAMTSAPEAGAAAPQATTPTPEAGAAQPSQTAMTSAPEAGAAATAPTTPEAAATPAEGANEAGQAVDQERRRRSPSPSPEPTAEASPAPTAEASPAPGAEVSPAPAVEASPAPAAEPAAAGAAAAPAAGADEVPKAKGNITDKRIKAFYDTPEAATKAIPALRELNKLVAASPAVAKVLKDKNLVATIFAPSNDAVKAALSYLNETQPGVDAKTLQEAGVLEGLLQYHVTAGNAAITSERLTNGMKLTMLNKEPTTIVVGADGSRRLLQDVARFIESNSGQKFAISDANYQGGKAILHVIDGVLIPKSMAENFNLTALPGFSNDTLAAISANETAAEPATAKPYAPAPAGAAAPKSSAGAAAATLLAVPALLAALML